MSTPAGFVTDPDKKVQGFAFYAEYYREANNKYFQIFITPDGVDENGYYVPARSFRRELTEEKPKKQWRQVQLSTTLVNEDNVLLDSITVNRLSPIEATLARLGAFFTLVKEPFFVEVSKKDLTDIRDGKTPIKVIYRIGQTRNALGFPEMFESK